ncbi:gag-protease polyprotein [Cucumis melo var. makuwa]|uniref:Gag-protease polyprotein n=1 Tax=Cucumis melo var. makuwa TaxID=1194695 RepID=A0A5D3CIM8_CUCMM|nr:gag-protease polyprotein [Cucumis melo var. makuwa]
MANTVLCYSPGRRGGRGVGCNQPEERPAVQAANPTEAVTQADLVAMEKRYQDMLRDALAPFYAAQQTLVALMTIFTKVPELEQGDMTMEQYDAKFDMLSRFTSDVVRDEAARIEKFVRGFRLELQHFLQAFSPTTYANALRLAVDMSLHEKANLSKTAGRRSTLGQKRKAEL